MKTTRKPYQALELIQGSPEWIEERFNYVTASQVAALVGLCSYSKREDILSEKLTRKEKEIKPFQNGLFEKGHKAEKVCRAWASKEYNLEFTQPVLISTKCPDLLASLDGFNAENKITLEAKYMGKKSLEDVRKGIIKPNHRIQVQAQLLVTGAEKCIYFAADDDALFNGGDAAFYEIYPDKFYHKLIPMIVTKFMNEVRSATV